MNRHWQWIFALAVSCASTQAEALNDSEIDAVLTRKAQKDLCTRLVGDTRFVVKDRLAEAILKRLDLPLAVLERANPGGGTYSATTISKLLEAAQSSNEDPLGLKDIPAAKSGLAELSEERVFIAEFLRNGSIETGRYARVGYLVRVPTTDRQATHSERPTFLDLFAPKGAVTIECLDVSDETGAGGSLFHRVSETVYGAFTNRFRLRGKVSDLSKPATGSNIQTLSTADLSLTSNDASGADTFAVNGVVGLDLSTDDLTFIPFAEYNQSETRKGGGTTEVEVLATGLLFSKLFINPDLAVEIDVEPKATLDLEQDSELVSFSASIDPAFDVLGVPVGIYSHLGPLRIRPNLIFKAQADYVVDVGQNPRLRDNDEFFRFGGVASLKAQFVDIPLLSSFVFEVSYEWHDFISSPLDDLRRFEAGASYFLGGAPNYVVSFKYVNGRNSLSLQDEEFWKVSLGARF